MAKVRVYVTRADSRSSYAMWTAPANGDKPEWGSFSWHGLGICELIESIPQSIATRFLGIKGWKGGKNSIRLFEIESKQIPAPKSKKK